MRSVVVKLMLLTAGLSMVDSAWADGPGATPVMAEIGADPLVNFQAAEPTATRFAEFAWADAEYLLWWMKPVCQKKPLLHFGHASDMGPVPRAILGDSKYEMPPASGVRATVGLWAPNAANLGWEASGFWLGRVQNTHAFVSPDGSPASIIPFTNENNAAQALLFTIPGQVGGRITATGSSELWGADTNVLWRFAAAEGDWSRRVSLLAGFRYVSLRDRIDIQQTQFLVIDPLAFGIGGCQFATDNEFYGAQVGARFEMERGRWGLEATGKFAPGEMHMISDVSGNPLIAGTQVLPGSVPGPLLVLPSNVGQVDRWALAFAQEFNLKLRCRLTQNVLATLGYNLLYLNRIACPGDQQPQFVNISQLPQFAPFRGKLEPTPILVHTDYFAQGLSAGLEIRY